MTVSTVKYLGEGRVEITHMATEQKAHTDAAAAFGGKAEFPTPVDMLAQALASCALTAMGVAANQEEANFEGCYAEVGEVEEDKDKFVVTRISITFHLKAEFGDKARKKMEQFAHKACFVGNTLTAEKNFKFIYE